MYMYKCQSIVQWVKIFAFMQPAKVQSPAPRYGPTSLLKVIPNTDLGVSH